MDQKTTRVSGPILHIGNDNVGFGVHEEYWPGESAPRRVTIYGPRGLRTEGGVKEAWREMFGHLGVAPPPDPEEVEAAPVVAGDEGLALPEPSCQAGEQVALAEPA